MRNFEKLFLVTVVGVLLSTGVFAQLSIHKGIHAGLNLATLTGDDVDELFENKGSRSTTALGVFLGFQVGPIVTIQPEVLYMMKGAEFDSAAVNITRKLDYIEIPILLKVNIPVQGNIVKPSVFAGPALGIKVNAEDELEGEGISGTDEREDIKNTDFGAVFGGSIGFAVGSIAQFDLGVRYNLGLTSVDDSAAEGDVKNSVLSFLGSISF